MQRKRLGMVLIGGLGLLVPASLAFFTIAPSNARDWKPEHAVLAGVRFDGNLVHVENIRNFRCRKDLPCEPGYYDRTFDLDTVESLWFVLAVFDEKQSRALAHSLLSFGFADGSYLAISVEARKEADEGYSALRGLFKKYEIIYVVGDERDLILTRAVARPDDVYLYPIRTEKNRIRNLLVDMLEKAATLRERPEFYNTLTNNCTTRLRDHVNRIVPGRIPPSWKVLLPGYADELLAGLNLLDAELSLQEARKRFRVNEQARRYAGSPDFSARIRE